MIAPAPSGLGFPDPSFSEDSAKQSHVLVIDPNRLYLKGLTKEAANLKHPLLVARTDEEAEKFLISYKDSIVCVYINPTISAAAWILLVRKVHETSPASPIFLIYDDIPWIDQADMDLMGIQEKYAKPVSFSEMLTYCGLLDSPDLPPTPSPLSLTDNLPSQNSLIRTSPDPEYIAIPLAKFVISAKSFFDLFIRVAGGKYLKVLAAGDEISRERVLSYIEKGASHLFIRAEAREAYINKCDTLLDSIVKDKDLDIVTKSQEVLHYGEQVMGLLAESGIKNEHFAHTMTYAKNTVNVIEELAKDTPVLNAFVKNLALYEHGVATAMIGSLLLKQLEVKDKPISNTVALALMLHDIALLEYKTDLCHMPMEKMTSEQKEIYLKHPEKSAEMLAELVKLPGAVVQAVKQHHMRREGGFPEREKATHISRIAEVIGVSDEMAKQLRKNTGDPAQWVIENILDQFSNPMKKAFIDCFKK